MDKELEFSAWEELKVGGTVPPKRYGHVCAMVGSRMYSFGGASSSEDDSTVYYNDLFVVDFGESPLCWKAVEQNGEVPSARESSTLSAYNDDLYLYGGVSQEGTYTCAEGLYIFRTSTNTWERSPTAGDAPLAQSLSTVVIGNKLVTFGGVLKGKPKNDTYILDLETMEWSLVETSGTPPSPRCDHACCVVGERMFVTAGSGGENVWFNDLFSLDLSTKTWTTVDVQGATPTPRDYATLCSVSLAYLIGFGGFTGCHGNDEYLSELSFIDLAPQKLSWCQAAVDSTSPSPRYGHSMVVHGNKVYIFAGQDTEGEYNDLWSISLKVPMVGYKPTPVPKPQYSTTTPIPAPRKSVKPAPPPEVKPRDFEELRSTYLQRINEMFDTLDERFQLLDSAMAKLTSERNAFEEEKKEHAELYDKQQQELKEQLENHQTQNDEWLEKIRSENDVERQGLAEERATLERASADLAKEQEMFQSKSEKLDAIMRQVQGLK